MSAVMVQFIFYFILYLYIYLSGRSYKKRMKERYHERLDEASMRGDKETAALYIKVLSKIK